MQLYDFDGDDDDDPKSGQITTTSSENGSKNRILENLCERVIEIYSWENWKSAKYDPLLGLIFKIF